MVSKIGKNNEVLAYGKSERKTYGKCSIKCTKIVQHLPNKLANALKI